MSIHHRIPESIRAVGGTLRFLLQPRIWGSVSVLTVVGIFFWQFSQNPEWFSLEGESVLNPDNSGSQLTPEEQSIAADIDNSKVLREALEGSSPFNSSVKSSDINNILLKQVQDGAKQSEASPRSNPLLDSLLNPSPPNSPAAVEGNSPTPSNLVNPVSQTPPEDADSEANLGLNRFGSPSTTAQNSETVKTSLQEAMQNYLQTQDTENQNGTGSTDTSNVTNNSQTPETNAVNAPLNNPVNPNIASNPIAGATVGVTPFTGTSTITGQMLQPSWSVPRGNPNPPVGTVLAPIQNPYQTNVTLPPVVPTVPTVTPGTAPNPGYANFNALPLNNTIPSYSVTPNTGTNSTVQPVQPNNYMTPSNLNPNIQPGQLGQTQPNFSVPNRAPGRYIGGGEINTFANP